MAEIHSLLKRQLKRHVGGADAVPAEWRAFVDAVNEAYRQADVDREMLERSMDISSEELLEANAEMRAALSVLKATLESTADGLLVVDRSGRIVTYNGRFAEMWGLPDEVLKARDDDRALDHVLHQLLHPEAFLARVRELYADVEAESQDLLEFKDGRLFERYSRPQRIGNTSVGRVWSFRDVTESRRAERERDRLYQEAQEAVRLRDEFLSVAAHELKTPVTSLRGFSQLLLGQLQKGEAPSPERLRRGLDVIERQSEKLSRLISQLLDVTRIEAGRFALDRRTTDLVDLVEDVVLSERATTSRHTIAVGAPASLPALVDPLRLEQVLINLIDNAIRYSPDGGSVGVQLESADGMARITVADRGRGVDPEQRTRIFERFFQGHGLSLGGMGLGLYVCREIVQRHGGRIEAEFPPEGGTRVVVTLPIGIEVGE